MLVKSLQARNKINKCQKHMSILLLAPHLEYSALKQLLLWRGSLCVALHF